MSTDPSEDQGFHVRNLCDVIAVEEAYVKHRSTMLIGDFNMDPYEASMTVADGLHAIMDKEIVRQQTRRVSGKDYLMFYNPMWARLGDESIGPPGTYFYNRSHALTYFWHTFDQVLLRPELLDCFNPDDLHVVTKAGSVPLLREDGKIDVRQSDHLPILVRLEL